MQANARTSAVPSRRLLVAVAVVCAWLAWGLLWSVTFAGAARMRGQDSTFWEIARGQIPQALAWAAATPLILWLGRRFPFERGRWPVSLAVHLCASAALLFAIDSFYIGLERLWSAPANDLTFLRSTTTAFIYWFSYDGLLYWMVLAIGQVIQYYRRTRERELREAALKRQLAETRLETLNMQLRPHFLFNVLNTIVMLIRTGEGKAAVSVATGLGDLLRRVLSEAPRAEVALREELEFVHQYLEIERARFGDRLRVALHVEPEALEAAVPHFILQPLVENAIHHGVAANQDCGAIEISAWQQDGMLWLGVRDDGPGLDIDDRDDRRGVGLTNTRERLEQMYPGNHRLDLVTPEAGGTEVRIGTPLRVAAVAATEDDRP